MSGIPFISRSWDEGRVWDLWMVVHFLTGVTGGFANVFLGLSIWALFVLGILSMIAWEIVEYARDVRESAENRAIDISFGMLGMFVAISAASVLSPSRQWAAFVASAVLMLLGCFTGWRAYRKRVAGGQGNAPQR